MVRAKVIRTHGQLVTVDIDGDHLGYTVDEVRLTN
jgi:exosome complex RNA-binding protein Csl4